MMKFHSLVLGFTLVSVIGCSGPAPEKATAICATPVGLIQGEGEVRVVQGALEIKIEDGRIFKTALSNCLVVKE